MTEQKYPAEIIETAKRSVMEALEPYLETIIDLDLNVYGEVRAFEGLAEVATCAALDALGLTVTEEFALDFEDELDGPMNRDEARLAHVEATLHPDQELYAHRFVGRHVLHAETPWVEVVSDGTE